MPDKSSSNYLVSTKVRVKVGEIEHVLKLFRETNPSLVKGEDDWIKAVFSKHEETNTLMVLAYWRSKESYLIFSRSKQFRETVQKFALYFVEEPTTEVSEILFEM